MISFADHIKNVNHFWNIGEQAFAIFKNQGAIEPWVRQDYYQNEVSPSDDGKSVHFTFECYDQGGTDQITIVLPNTLVDNFVESECIAAAIKQRDAIHAEAVAKKAAEAQRAVDSKKVELAHTFIKRASELTTAGTITTALDLADSMQDPELNKHITLLENGLKNISAQSTPRDWDSMADRIGSANS